MWQRRQILPPIASATSTGHLTPTPSPQHRVPSVFLGPKPGPQLGSMDLNVPLGCISKHPQTLAAQSPGRESRAPPPTLGKCAAVAPRSHGSEEGWVRDTAFVIWGIWTGCLYYVQGQAMETLYYGGAEIPRIITSQEAPVSCSLSLGRGSVHFRKSHDWFPQSFQHRGRPGKTSQNFWVEQPPRPA